MGSDRNLLRIAVLVILLGGITTLAFVVNGGCSPRAAAPAESTTQARLSQAEPPCCCRPCDAGVAPVPPAPPDAPPVVDPPDPPSPTPTRAHPRILMPRALDRLRALASAKHEAHARWMAAADRWLAGSNIWGWQAWHGALASQLGHGPQYCAKAVAQVDAYVRSEEALVASGKNPAVAGDSYLEVGDRVGDAAIVMDWCHAATTPAQRARWLALANQAVWNVWNHKAASWGGRSAPWTGWSVDNPSNNYHYSFMRATMLLALASAGEPQGDRSEEWTRTFRAKLAAAHATFARDLPGGGSREGTGYGVAMRRLFEIYSWWQASTGESIANLSPHARESISAFTHQLMPTIDRVAPIGDHSRDSTAALHDYHRHYLLELVALYPGDSASRRVLALLAASSVPRMQNQFMLVYDLLLADASQPTPADGAPTAYRAAGIGGLYARTSWSRDAAWVGLQGGPYTESHAHQDQGSMMLYQGGAWLVGDAVLWSKSGLPQGPEAHSLVRVDGARQRVGTTSRVVLARRGPGWTWLGVDATASYAGDARVQLHQREVVLVAGLAVVLDRVTTAAGSAQVQQWVVGELPTVSGSTFAAGRLRGWTQGNATATPLRSLGADLTGGWRVDVSSPGGALARVTVLAWDPSVASVSVRDHGASAVVGGQAIDVSFARQPAVGGTIKLGSAPVATAVSGAAF